MTVIIYIILILAIWTTMYGFITKIKRQKISAQIKEKIITQKNNYQRRILKLNNNKIKIMDSLYLLLIKTGIIENKYLWWITPMTIIFICCILFFVSFLIFLPILKLKILTVIFCIPIATIPIFILLVLSDIFEQRIEKNLINYIIQLKNQAKINNDIIICFKNTKKYIQKPLSTYIQIFLFEIQQGVNISVAFDNLKEKVDFNRFKQLISNLENCYYNGGNLYDLLEKTQTVFLKLQNERNKRNEETMSARVVLGILMAISIFVYFRFINFNQENFDIMINSFWGQLILVFNFFSIWGMMFLIIYVKRFDS